MSNVYLKKCDSYDFSNLKECIRVALDSTSFKDIKETDSVFIKVNSLGAYPENLAITTNPLFLKAVIQLVKEKTKHIKVGDNPANKELVSALKKNGMFKVIEEEKVNLFLGALQTTITNHSAHTYKEFDVSKEIIDADYLINLPKLKTHTLTYFSCAQKNLFGLIYGLQKSSWHVKAPTPLDFAYVICDLYGAIKENFENGHIINLCDGITCLEGEGPSTSGSPKHAGIILASNDAISLDQVALSITKLNKDKYIIGKIANEENLGEANLDNIAIIGDDISLFSDVSLREPDQGISSKAMKFLRNKFIRNICLEHPRVDKDLCVKCGECTKMCSSHALTIEKGTYPSLSSSKCIRCWCCQEICPHHAIKKTKRPIIGKILFK
ncbi:MAG: DUF362 domain-containing protein [Bacilli bacterium]|nr:DUF362 domain-containing protein [Bacilli bacterium]